MFAKLSTLKYPYTGGVELAGLALANLPGRLDIDKSYLIERKIVLDGETPESLAYKLYRRADLHWTLLYLNNIRDPHTEWPIREGFLREFADLKYSLNSMETIHHFRDLRDNTEIHDYEAKALIEAGPPYPEHLHPVSYYEMEVDANNERRKIIAITSKHIHDFAELYENLIRGRA